MIMHGLISDFTKLWELTANPDDGSIKSAQNPSVRRARQISFAPAMNCTKQTTFH